jgi:segregation and condensation protein B
MSDEIPVEWGPPDRRETGSAPDNGSRPQARGGSWPAPGDGQGPRANTAPEPRAEGEPGLRGGEPGWQSGAEPGPSPDGEPGQRSAAGPGPPADGEPGPRAGGEPGPPADGEPGLRAALEAILLVVDEPVAEVTLAQILERPRDEVSATLHELAAEYTAQGRGFDLREVAGGWRFYTRQECAPLVERFVTDGQQTRLTQAALETLAVVAYRQPVSRARVSAIRGVISDGVIRTLTLRGLIEEAGHDPEHQAILYRTTSYFLERLGLRSLDELPDLAPFLPDDVADIEDQEL